MSFPIPSTKFLSIFIVSMCNFSSISKFEYSIPKSSIAILNPFSLKSFIFLFALFVLFILNLSITSKQILFFSKFYLYNISIACFTKLSFSISFKDILSEI